MSLSRVSNVDVELCHRGVVSVVADTVIELGRKAHLEIMWQNAVGMLSWALSSMEREKPRSRVENEKCRNRRKLKTRRRESAPDTL